MKYIMMCLSPPLRVLMVFMAHLVLLVSVVLLVCLDSAVREASLVSQDLL